MKRVVVELNGTGKRYGMYFADVPPKGSLVCVDIEPNGLQNFRVAESMHYGYSQNEAKRDVPAGVIQVTPDTPTHSDE